MKFWEAMKALEEGKKIRCKEWPSNVWDSKYGTNGSHLLSLDVYSSHEWELYEEPLVTLSFAEVVIRLKEGKKFRRLSWNKGFYIHISRMKNDLVYCFTNEGTQYVYIMTIGDIDATDWIEMK